MQYADIRELKSGQIVHLDAGFTCRHVGPVLLETDALGQLGFKCSAGFHNLDGQCDDGFHCVGVYTTPNKYTKA